ncbi:MAG TPA: TIR domain-containing protein [Alphaproteobacteria bacterium]|nr:TIR domain-containing protein [Alphaproteobacteria bacterium]
MADIFVSYARAERARVAPLVAALEAQGWSVWWDPAITPGAEFDSLIRREIDAAKVIVVVWTPASVESRWVRGEARIGADRGALVPVRFDAARLPIDAMAIHTTDLDDWKHDSASAQFQELLSALKVHLKDVARAGTGAKQQVSICVLPFANMSNDEDQEYFSDGISEDIITDLSKVSALSVIARNSAFAFKGKQADLLQVARQLKVSHILEGSVRKSGNRVRITAQLINGATNDHVWAERYDRDLADIFALQDEISEAIVSALKLKLLPEEKQAIEDRGTKSLEAYDLHLRGNSAYAQMGYENAARATKLFREALLLDPGFSLARTSLVGALGTLQLLTAADRAGIRQEIEDLIEGGILEAKDLSQSHYWRGRQKLEHDDWLGAEQAFERSIALSPASDLELMPFRFELFNKTGRISEAFSLASEMSRKDPLSLFRSVTLQVLLAVLFRVDEAETEYQRTRTLSGDRSPAEIQALVRRWRHSTAAERKEQFQRVLASDDSITASFIPRLQGVIDQPEAARRVLRQAFADIHDQEPFSIQRLALFAALFGDPGLALDCLRRVHLDLGASLGTWHPLFAEARKDPRFKDLVRDLGLYDYWKKSGHWGDFARPKGDDDFEIVR